ncbi:hypothetical protein B296_00050103 [Ensete ventricosum]|uniref:Uncharacterized protein n=1 Tax=Ensete ventricosum TaxID=4639 RepID=A0A426WZU3_ENSVE|nr:hypothetical protein B296_00050103 [Ensete ventricosum]
MGRRININPKENLPARKPAASLPHYNSAPEGPFPAPSSNLLREASSQRRGRMIGVIMGPLPNRLTWLGQARHGVGRLTRHAMCPLTPTNDAP